MKKKQKEGNVMISKCMFCQGLKIRRVKEHIFYFINFKSIFNLLTYVGICSLVSSPRLVVVVVVFLYRQRKAKMKKTKQKTKIAANCNIKFCVMSFFQQKQKNKCIA